MATALAITGWTLFTLVILVGLALNAVGLFGNWLILLAIIVAWLLTDFVHFGPWILLIMFLLCILGEILETALAGYGARRFGGSKGAMVAALVGCIVGAILGSPVFPILGTLAGGAAGAFVAASIYEFIRHKKAFKEALWTGFGAGMGKMGGIVAKFTCGIGILVLAFFSF